MIAHIGWIGLGWIKKIGPMSNSASYTADYRLVGAPFIRQVACSSLIADTTNTSRQLLQLLLRNITVFSEHNQLIETLTGWSSRRYCLGTCVSRHSCLSLAACGRCRRGYASPSMIAHTFRDAPGIQGNPRHVTQTSLLWRVSQTLSTNQSSVWQRFCHHSRRLRSPSLTVCQNLDSNGAGRGRGDGTPPTILLK